MTLLKKTAVILVSFMVILIFITLTYLCRVSLHSYIDHEEKYIAGSLNVSKEIIKKEIDGLNTTCRDCAFRDDTYLFVENQNEAYINSNFSKSTYLSNRIDFVVITDKKGIIVFSKAYDNNLNSLVELPKDLLGFIKNNSEITTLNDKNKPIKGICVLPAMTLFLVAEPVLSSDLSKSANGTLIFGRFLNVSEINYLSETANMNLNFINLASNENTPALNNILENFNNNRKEYHIEYNSNELASAYMPLLDINNDSKLIMNISFSRNIFLEGLNSVIRFSYLSVILIILIFGLVLLILQKLFLKRLVNLNSAVSEIEYEGLYNLKIEDKYDDEISSLTLSIKNLLEKINESEKNLVASERKYRSLFENSIDGISIRTKEGKFIDANNALVEILGYDSKDELLKADIPTEIYADKNDFYRVNSLDKNYCVFKIKKKDGTIISAEITAQVVKEDVYGLHYENIIRNITERVKKEEEIEYLSFYDKLTGIYNRAYMEEEIKKIDNPNYLPLSIIMIDVNGLRIINDLFSSKAGDEVLRKIADSLRNSCRQGEIISRWGGDEFIIVLPKTPEQITNKMGERIIENCSKIFYKNFAISVSLGSNTKNKMDENLHELLVEAENRMYKHKLFEMKSIYSSIILSLERVLWEKSNETKEHAERLKKLVIAIGKEIRLPGNLLDDLTLLASLHDIGKIAISDAILTKKAKLSEKEWEIIKKHPDVGYQIAKSSPQISHIADGILYHHEWWDGSGYPKGLSGESIPLISRIVSIVDAYDVMIEGRVYKSALSSEEAINELKRCSGIQFDPDLVKIFIKILEKTN